MIGSGIKRGTAELAVLSVLQDGPLHGYELKKRLGDTLGFLTAPGFGVPPSELAQLIGVTRHSLLLSTGV